MRKAGYFSDGAGIILKFYEVKKMLSENIKNLRKKRKMSLEQLAEMVGTSRQTIYRYETGAISNVPPDKVESLARALGATPAELMGWEEISTFNYIEGAEAVRQQRIPLLGNVSCGEPIFASEDYSTFVSAEEVKADFCLRAKGDSMINARIFDGDMLFVKKQESVDDGEIAVVLIEDEATVKRVYYDKENNVLTLMPENPTYKPMRFMNSQLNQIRILGKVISGQYKI